jgi:hypothetical protein
MRLRSSSALPSDFEIEGIKLYFSQDGLAGGTWLGYTQFNRLICLLNGAFDFYMPEPPYRKSRGQIVLDCLKLSSLDELIGYNEFDQIEPFTMIIIDWSKELKLYEIRWDGDKKHCKALNNETQIWSSAPLYNQQMRDMRSKWFDRWMINGQAHTLDGLLDFHKNAGNQDPITAINMSRKYFCTVSITGIEKKDDILRWKYFDVIGGQEKEELVKF